MLLTCLLFQDTNVMTVAGSVAAAWSVFPSVDGVAARKPTLADVPPPTVREPGSTP